MRILLQEFITGGGLWSADESLAESESLLREGRAMIRAIAADFANIPDCEVTVLRDARFSKLQLPGCKVLDVGSAGAERIALTQLASQLDGVLLIAPETDGLLAERVSWVSESGGRLLSPGIETVRLASDKDRTVRWLADHHLPVPLGVAASAERPITKPWPYRFPVVAKLLDGAGSSDMRLLANDNEIANFDFGNRRWRFEAYCPGQPASVAVLCGPAECRALPACSQRLSDDGRFQYRGGVAPLFGDRAVRARNLALRTVAALPPTVGYMGIDLVLGDDPSGGDDCVIEINPRLTTSYVGLRQLSKTNLAAAMLAIARGESVELRFESEPVEFDAEGEVRKQQCNG